MLAQSNFGDFSKSFTSICLLVGIVSPVEQCKSRLDGQNSLFVQCVLKDKRGVYKINIKNILNLVPRVFLRHTLITKPNEHPGTLR